MCGFIGVDHYTLAEKAVALYENRNAKNGCFKTN
jgi:hypothetical protein